MSRSSFAFGLVVWTVLAWPAVASDHADPADILRNRDADDRGITDLFAFPVKGEQRVVGPNAGDADAVVFILCVNRLLTAPPPYPGLDGFRFTIHIDTRREVNIDYPRDEGKPTSALQRDSLRYGGVVVNPELIDSTLSIQLQLRNDLIDGFRPENVLTGTVTAKDQNGQSEQVPIGKAGRYVSKYGAGVRDDPFIFPPFFGTNAIAMAVRVPRSALGSGPLVLWATAERRGTQTDHVGRSQRTQLPRFDFLNTLHPKDHVAAIRKKRTDPSLTDDLAKYAIPTEFGLRGFDDQPDVMIFSPAQRTGYPNGRQLEDDVAKLTCLQGDCQLYELSFAKPRLPASEVHSQYQAGRPTANDRPFLETWPYLAEPWSDPPPAPPPPGLTMKNMVFLALIALFVLAMFLLPWFLYFRSRKQLRRLLLAPPTEPAK